MEFCRVLDEEHFRRMLECPSFSILSRAPELFPTKRKKGDDNGVTDNGFVIALAGTNGAAVILRQKYPYDREPLLFSGLP